jgi:hypothetical protein
METPAPTGGCGGDRGDGDHHHDDDTVTTAASSTTTTTSRSRERSRKVAPSWPGIRPAVAGGGVGTVSCAPVSAQWWV